MKTTNTYSIKNEMTGAVVKTALNFNDVRKFKFNKMSKANFSRVACVDYIVIDEVDNDTFPLSQIPI